MKAAVWHGRRDVRVDEVADPTIREPTDAIVEITTTGLCGSDLHLYEVLGPFMTEGDILGHEPMGVVRAVGLGRDQPRRGRSRRRPVQHLVRQLLHVRPRAAVAVRDDTGPRARLGRRPVRLHKALRRGRRRAGRTAAGAARGLWPGQGPTGTARRPLRVPLGRAPDRVAGGRVRRHPRGRQRRGAGARADRRHGVADRPPPWRGHRDRHRPRPGAPAARERAGAPTSSTSRATSISSPRCRRSPPAADPTP